MGYVILLWHSLSLPYNYSGINRILIYIPASQKCRLTCHPVYMQLPMNASLAFFGFIMYFPLLDGHVGF